MIRRLIRDVGLLVFCVALAVAGHASQFVVVGEGGTILTSPDGQTWTSRVSGTALRLRGVAASAGRLIAVGEGGTILTSTAGETWTPCTTATTETLRGVSVGAGRFVVVGGYSTGYVLTSDDGINWSPVTLPEGSDKLRSVAWGNGLFVAVGAGGTALVSANGLSWSRITFASSARLDLVLWTGSQFRVVAENGQTWTSANGSDWAGGVSVSAPAWLEGLAWNDARYVVVGANGAIRISSDGDSWVQALAGETAIIHGVTWSGTPVSPIADLLTSLHNLTNKLVITAQPQDVQQLSGYNPYAFFGIEVSGAEPIFYQWRLNGVSIPGAIHQYHYFNTPQPAHEGQYDVIITNAYGSVTSTAGTFSLAYPPSVSEGPANQAVLSGGRATFAVTVAGTGPFTYQWERLRPGGVWQALADGGNINGASTATLAIDPVGFAQAGEAYRCRVTGWRIITSGAGKLFLITNAGGISVAAGGSRGAFLCGDGTAWGLGLLSYQPEGANSNAWDVPVEMAGSVASISVGDSHVLLLKTDGTLWAMGNNNAGQLGDGTRTNRISPGQSTTDVVAAAAGFNLSFYIKTDGTLWSAGSTPFSAQPIQVATNVRAVSVSPHSASDHVLILKSDGSLWGRGSSHYGQLGLGHAAGSVENFAQIATGVRAIAAGEYHSLFVKDDGSLWGMGSNEMGELGDGGATNRYAPVAITTGVANVAAGSRRSFFIKQNGELWGMGSNEAGALGDGSTINRPSPVLIADNVVSVATANSMSIFAKRDGSVWSVGNNYFGELGVGDTVNRTTPVQVAFGTLVVPAVPAGLSASDATTYTGVHLNWGAVLGATSYEVRRSPIHDPSTATLLATDVTSAYYEDTTGLAGQTYHYWVRAENPAGMSEWSTADFGAKASAILPVITDQPQSRMVNAALGNREADFTVSATGTGPLLYQWRRNGHNLFDSFYVQGALSPTLSLTDFGLTDGGVITVVVSNPAGSVESTPVDLIIGNPPTINQQPLGQVVAVGQSATFTVTLINDSYSPPASFQWKRNGAPLDGETGATLTLENFQPTDAGSYTVVVSNLIGSTTSTAAELTLSQLDQIITFGSLADHSFAGAPITLSATASSGLAVSFTVVSGPATVAGNQLTLTGTGTVTVRAAQAGDSTYAAATPVDRSFVVTGNLSSWLSGKFTSGELADPSISGPNADPDGDGYSNLMEYALGLEPKSPSTTGLPEVGTTSTDWVYTYIRPTDRTDLTYMVEVSTDLSTWTSLGVTHGFLASAGDGKETWRAHYPLASAANVFFRLRATGQ